MGIDGAVFLSRCTERRGIIKKSFACDAVLFKMSQFVSVIINHHSNAFIVHSSFITVTQKRLL